MSTELREIFGHGIHRVRVMYSIVFSPFRSSGMLKWGAVICFELPVRWFCDFLLEGRVSCIFTTSFTKHDSERVFSCL